MYASVRDFLAALDRTGELRRVTAPISPVLDIAWAADRASKSKCPVPGSPQTQKNDPRFHDRGGHALLFENVQGSDIPVLINGWGSYHRMEMALGCPEGHGFEWIADKIAGLVKPEPPSSLKDAIAKAKQFLPLLRIPPKRRRGSGPCQEIVLTGEKVDCTRLPILRCWPHDGDFATLGYPAGVNDGIEALGHGPDWDRDFRGRYITLAGIHTVHADDRDHPKPPSHNIGMYRVQLLGKQRLAMHWHMHHDGARHWRSWKKLGKPMPVAIALGGESVMPYAATAPLPPGISELLLAGFLNGRGIPMVRGKTVPLWVPANAEIVIEGFVSNEAGFIDYDPRRDGPIGPGAVFEGPFGDHTGFYSLPDRYPILTVTAITHRKHPVYPTTVVGLPPQEDYFLGKATERIFMPLLKTLIHDIEDYDLPMFGAFHNAAILQIKKAYPLQGRRVMHSVWGAGQMAWTKTLFVVDDDVDVHDTMKVLEVAGERCHPLRDVETVHGPLDILDHAAPRLGAGMKIGFDCTRKRDGEQVHGVEVDLPSDVNAKGTQSAKGDVCAAVRGIERVRDARLIGGDAWLLMRIEKTGPRQGREVLSRVFEALGDGRKPGFVIVVSGDVDLADADAALFHWCAHTDASRDMLRWASADGRVHRVGFDATVKLKGDEANGQPVRDWPPILQTIDDVRHRIAARAPELGITN